MEILDRGETWTIRAHGTGTQVRELTISEPRAPGAREDVALLSASLLRPLTAQTRPPAPAPPPAPLPAPVATAPAAPKPAPKPRPAPPPAPAPAPTPPPEPVPAPALVMISKKPRALGRERDQPPERPGEEHMSTSGKGGLGEGKKEVDNEVVCPKAAGKRTTNSNNILRALGNPSMPTLC